MAAPAKLYVGNLKGAVTEGDLDSLFRTYGRVRQIWVARQPPGFAYVTMEEDREADDSDNAEDDETDEDFDAATAAADAAAASGAGAARLR